MAFTKKTTTKPPAAPKPATAAKPQMGRIKVRQPDAREALRGSPKPPAAPKKES